MRRISRLQSPLNALRETHATRQGSAYLCSACRHQASFSTTASAQEETPFSERLRRKIWGTDNPPGQKDPYSPMTEGELAEESMQRLRKQAKAKTPGIRYRPARNLSELEVLKPLAPRPIPIPRFGPIEMVTDDEEITTCLHRALVEVYTLRQAGKPLSEAWAVDPISDQTHTVQIRLNDDGEVNLVYSADMTSKKVLDSLVASVEDVEDVEVEDELVAEEEEDEMVTRAQSEMKSTEASLSEPASTDKPGEIVAVADQTSEETPATPKTYRDVINSWDTTWLLTPLKDMEIKFAVLTRLRQLTGIRIADSSLRNIEHAGHLYKLLCKPPKAAKLAEELVRKNQLTSLSNVTIHAKKITQSQKETQLGRWKIIEHELKKRGLPVEHRPRQMPM